MKIISGEALKSFAPPMDTPVSIAVWMKYCSGCLYLGHRNLLTDNAYSQCCVFDRQVKFDMRRRKRQRKWQAKEERKREEEQLQVPQM